MRHHFTTCSHKSLIETKGQRPILISEFFSVLAIFLMQFCLGKKIPEEWINNSLVKRYLKIPPQTSIVSKLSPTFEQVGSIQQWKTAPSKWKEISFGYETDYKIKTVKFDSFPDASNERVNAEPLHAVILTSAVGHG